ncbi:hypothetical protein BGX38DRAFT_1279513 [Terfezia claveryi]|nr:hypothetical protein BGX38DRAFT_1279513 [Terfezia claveryi]
MWLYEHRPCRSGWRDHRATTPPTYYLRVQDPQQTPRRPKPTQPSINSSKMMQAQVAAGGGPRYTRSHLLRPHGSRPVPSSPLHFCSPTGQQPNYTERGQSMPSPATLEQSQSPNSDIPNVLPLPSATGQDVHVKTAAPVAVLQQERGFVSPLPTSGLFQYNPFESTTRFRGRTLPPLLPIADLSPDNLRYLSILANEVQIASYHIRLSDYHKWIEQYPALCSETGNLHQHFQCRRLPHQNHDGNEPMVSLNIKTIPSAYHDVIGRDVSRQTRKNIEQAIGDPYELRLSIGNTMEFVGFEGDEYDDLLAPTAKKVPDCAILPASAEFPSVAIEVGFSESWEDLLSDAHLWLHGTKDETKAVLLFVLREGTHVDTYSVGEDKIPKSVIYKEKFTWPFIHPESLDDQEPPRRLPMITLNDPDSPLLRMLNPAESSRQEIARPAERALRDYYLTADKVGTLFPQLVEPLDATVFLFRRKTQDTSAAIPLHEFDDPTPKQRFRRDLECHFKCTFMRDDTAVRHMEKLTINICELLGTGDESDGVVVYDLEELAEEIKRERPRMATTRAVERAAAAVAKLQLKHSAWKKQELEDLIGKKRIERTPDNGEDGSRKKRRVTGRNVLGNADLKIGPVRSFAELKKLRKADDYHAAEENEEEERDESKGLDKDWNPTCGV